MEKLKIKVMFVFMLITATGIITVYGVMDILKQIKKID